MSTQALVRCQRVSYYFAYYQQTRIVPFAHSKSPKCLMSFSVVLTSFFVTLENTLQHVGR